MTNALFEESLPSEFKNLIMTTDMLWDIEEGQEEQIITGLIDAVDKNLLTNKDIVKMIDYVASKRPKNVKYYVQIIKEFANKQNYKISPKNVSTSPQLKAVLLLENVIYGAMPEQYNNSTIEQVYNIFEKDSLLYALFWDDLPLLQHFTFDVDFDINQRRFGYTLLDHCAKYGSETCFKFLLANDARFTSETLEMAYLGNNLNIIHLSEEETETNNFCLKNAVACHNYNAAYYLHDKYLFEYKYYWALESYNFSMFFNKVYESDDIDARDADGETALLCATRLGIKSIVQMLVEKGANIEITDKHGNTPLIIAAKQKLVDIFDYLISKSANINAQNTEGFNAMMYASENEHNEILEKLFQKKARVDLTNIYDCSALMLAARSNRPNVVKTLIKKYAYVERRSKEGYTALLLAVQNNNIEVVKVLIDNKCNLEARTNEGFSALMIAAENNYVEIVKLLLENNARIEAIDEYGFTAKILASRYKHEEVIKLLKKYNKKCYIC